MDKVLQLLEVSVGDGEEVHDGHHLLLQGQGEVSGPGSVSASPGPKNDSRGFLLALADMCSVQVLVTISTLLEGNTLHSNSLSVSDLSPRQPKTSES